MVFKELRQVIPFDYTIEIVDEEDGSYLDKITPDNRDSFLEYDEYDECEVTKVFPLFEEVLVVEIIRSGNNILKKLKNVYNAYCEYLNTDARTSSAMFELMLGVIQGNLDLNNF